MTLTNLKYCGAADRQINAREWWFGRHKIGDFLGNAMVPMELCCQYAQVHTTLSIVQQLTHTH